jgi:hypothetical protein
MLIGSQFREHWPEVVLAGCGLAAIIALLGGGWIRSHSPEPRWFRAVSTMRAAGAASRPSDVSHVLKEIRSGDLLASGSVAKLNHLGASALPELVKALDDPDRKVRLVILRALVTLAPHRAEVSKALMLQLMKALKDPSLEIRFAAVTVISRCGERRADAVPALLQALERPGELDEDQEFYRIAVIFILGRIGKPAEAAIPQLVALLDEENLAVRQHSALAIWRISHNPELVVPPLTKMLEGPDASERHLAATVLHQIRFETSACPELDPALHSRRPPAGP